MNLDLHLIHEHKQIDLKTEMDKQIGKYKRIFQLLIEVDLGAASRASGLGVWENF